MTGHKSAVMTLDQYGHLFGELDIVADANGRSTHLSARWWVPSRYRRGGGRIETRREIAFD